MKIFFNPQVLSLNFKSVIKDNFDSVLDAAIERFKNNPTEENKLELFNLVDKKLKETSVGNSIFSAEDIYQEKVLALFELLATIENIENPLDEIKNIISSSFYNQKTANITRRAIPLDKKIKNKGKNNTLCDILTEDKIQKPLSAPNSEDIEKCRAELAKMQGIKNFEFVKQYYGIDCPKKTYSQIASENNIDDYSVRQKVKTSILEMQIKEGIIPQKTKKQMEEFKNEFLKGKIPDEKLDSTVNKIFTKCMNLRTYPVKRMKENVEGMAEIFKDEGLTVEKYIKAALRQPSLFYRLPKTIEKNVRNLVKKFENDGLTIEEYIKLLLKQPQLFYQSPEAIEKNVKNFVEKFKDEGLIMADYLKAISRQPELLCLAPDNVEKKVRDFVKRFEKEGLTIEGYLRAFIKQPELFCVSPDSIERKIRIAIYRRKCEAYAKGKEPKICVEKLLRCTTHSKESIFLEMLNTLIFNGIGKTKINEAKLKTQMPEFLKEHKDEIFNIKILNDPLAIEFIEFAKAYSNEILGKNVFNVEIVDE